MDKIRSIIIFQRHFHNFYENHSVKVQKKIDEVLFMITVLERVPKKFFDHLEGIKGLYEIRIEFSGNIFRIFCCFDEGKLIVLFNAFQKKTQKTPKIEIEKAEELQNEYFKSKKK